MTLLNRLQQTQPETLHKDSDRRLESFRGKELTGVLLLDEGKAYSHEDAHIFVSHLGGNRDTSYDFYRTNTYTWECHKQETGKDTEIIEDLSMSDMQDARESLKKVGMKSSPLMQRAICGIAVQFDRAIRTGESLMTTAMRRASLSVDKDGKIYDMKATQMQNQGGRS